MVGVWRIVVHLVPGVRPTDANQDVILWGDVRRDMTLALASVAPADDHIDEPFIPAPVESKVTGCPDRHICR